MNMIIAQSGMTKDPFKMDRYEAAKFVEKNERQIIGLLRGKYEDKVDALSQIKCKILEIAIENGEILRFTKGQLKEARTYAGWLSFFACHVRARMGIIQTQRSAWYDKDVMSAFGLRADYDETDDMSVAECAYVSGLDRDEACEVSDCEGEVGGEADEVEHALEKPSALVKWQKERRHKRNRILGAVAYYQGLHNEPKTHSSDRQWVSEEVRAEVRRIADEAGFSNRDIEAYCLAVFKEHKAKEVLEKMPELVSTSNIDRIKSLIKAAVEEAAYKPGSKLAFLYAA